MPGARCTRSLACAMGSQHTSIVTVGSPDQPGIPARNGFNGFLRDLPGDRAFLSPSPAVCLRKLDASVEASGPHDFAVRLGVVRQRHLRVHRIPPRVRDDRDTPLWWDETARTTVVICVGRKPKYFSKWDWTGKSLICASSQIAVLSVGSANIRNNLRPCSPHERSGMRGEGRSRISLRSSGLRSYEAATFCGRDGASITKPS